MKKRTFTGIATAALITTAGISVTNNLKPENPLKTGEGTVQAATYQHCVIDIPAYVTQVTVSDDDNASQLQNNILFVQLQVWFSVWFVHVVHELNALESKAIAIYY